MSWPSSAITATANGSSSALRTPADLTYSALGNIRCSRLSAIGERTLLNPHANSTACGVRAAMRSGCFHSRHASRDHALAFPVQHGDQREQPAGGFEIDPHLAV